MRQIATANYTNCTNWLRRSSCVRIVMLLALFNSQFSMVNSVKAQQENTAFYIYQNDGHFDGFFYDEVEKISYSFLDTLGIEHGEIVSQEIVTADSTYRIMLSAIDSVGFVQPEMKYNPRVRHYETDKLFFHLRTGDYIDHTWYMFDKNTPEELMPMVGDVFVDFANSPNTTYRLRGWCVKVTAVNKNNDGSIGVACEPVTDISDIFQQFVTIEEYGYDDNGNLARRRVAGRPDLTIGKFPRKADGKWEGDIFNFSINGHLPIYATDDLNITLDPSIEGKLHMKTAWNLSLFGNKYISITSKLKFGVGLGFTVDGKIKDFFPSGIGQLGSIPVPATCPLFIINCGPDAFIRGEAHLSFKMSSPKLTGAMWSKLELKNWIPSMDIGFGNSDDGSDFEVVDKSSAGVNLSLSGFVQAGMLFPLKFQSLPILKKICDVEIGGQWFVGPKVSAEFAYDLTSMPWDDVAAYNQLKNITLGLHLMDADFEVKAKAETLAGISEVTLADGSFNLFPPYDVKLVPEFGNCVEYVEDRMTSDGLQKCRIFAFEPQGNVVAPVKVGTALFRILDDGTKRYEKFWWQQTPYFNISGNLGQEYDKHHWAEAVIPVNYIDHYRGKFKLSPIVFMPAGKSDFIVASPEHEFEYGRCHIKASTDEIQVGCDGSHDPVTVTGDFDRLIMDGSLLSEAPDNYVEVSGSNGYWQLKLKKGEWLRNISPLNKRRSYIDIAFHGERTTEYGEIFKSPRLTLPVWVAPNTCEDPEKVGFGAEFHLDQDHTWRVSGSGMTWNITRTDNIGWHCKGTLYSENKVGDYTLVDEYYVEFDLEAVPYPNGDTPYSFSEHYDFDNFIMKNGTVTCRHKNNGVVELEVHDTFSDVYAIAKKSPFVRPVEHDIYPDHVVERQGEFTSDKGNRIGLSIYFKSNEEWSDTD